MLTERHGNAQNLPFAFWRDAGGDQHGRIAYLPGFTHLFITRIQVQILDCIQRSFSQLLPGRVQPRGCFTHLAGRHTAAAQLLDNRRHFAGGNALHIHFRQAQGQRPLAAQSFFNAEG